MADIDEVLRNGLQADAPPVDSAGVLDAIRQRVAAGDVGTTAGAGGPFPGGGHLLGWLGAGALAIAVGGAAGIVGLPESEAGAATAPQVVDVVGTAPGLHCPAGQPVVSFSAGDRVYAVARSADSAWLGVRSPFDRSRVVWVAANRIDPDAGAEALAELPEGGCEEGHARAIGKPKGPVTQPAEPTAPTEPMESEEPSDEADPQPEKEPKKPKEPGSTKSDPPAPVNQAPKVISISVTGTPFCDSSPPDPAYVKVVVSDDQAVTKVRVTWSGADSGSTWMTRSGGAWTYTYPAADVFHGDVTFTARAYDADGETSAIKSDSIYVGCLI